MGNAPRTVSFLPFTGSTRHPNGKESESAHERLCLWLVNKNWSGSRYTADGLTRSRGLSSENRVCDCFHMRRWAWRKNTSYSALRLKAALLPSAPVTSLCYWSFSRVCLPPPFSPLFLPFEPCVSQNISPRNLNLVIISLLYCSVYLQSSIIIHFFVYVTNKSA